MTRKVILASQSPRRRELLALCLTEFEVKAAHIDERAVEAQILAEKGRIPFSELAATLVETLASRKAAAIRMQEEETSLIIAADTVVVLDEEILGKPKDQAEALRMLRAMAGREHQVLTGVSVQCGGEQDSFSVESRVRFFDWDEQMEAEVHAYVASGSPLDKAGAYGIQEKPALWVKEISGDYSNIVGLPVAYLNKVLRKYN